MYWLSIISTISILQTLSKPIETCETQQSCLGITRQPSYDGKRVKVCLTFNPSESCIKDSADSISHTCPTDDESDKIDKFKVNDKMCKTVKCGTDALFGVKDGKGCAASNGLDGVSMSGIDGISCSATPYCGGGGNKECTWTIPAGDCSTAQATTADPTTANPTTTAPTTASPTTPQPATAEPTTADPTTATPTTSNPTTANPTTVAPTTVNPTTSRPTTAAPTTATPTTISPTTANPTTGTPTTSAPTTPQPATCESTCSDIDEPVCGTDGVSYINFCHAVCNGAGIDYEGPCSDAAAMNDGGIDDDQLNAGGFNESGKDDEWEYVEFIGSILGGLLLIGVMVGLCITVSMTNKQRGRFRDHVIVEMNVSDPQTPVRVATTTPDVESTDAECPLNVV